VSTDVPCSHKHTPYQPSDDEWRCPNCGADNDHFYIVEPVGDTYNCPFLHAADEVGCSKCDKGWTGTRLGALLAKRKSVKIEKCPTCKGHGFVEVKIEPKETP
jgi:radical SAM protein with 4Fe4S-binding SPASM domain